MNYFNIKFNFMIRMSLLLFFFVNLNVASAQSLEDKVANYMASLIIREHLFSIGLVDVKVAAIDKDWSGLKFVYRIKDRDDV